MHLTKEQMWTTLSLELLFPGHSRVNIQLGNERTFLEACRTDLRAHRFNPNLDDVVGKVLWVSEPQVENWSLAPCHGKGKLFWGHTALLNMPVLCSPTAAQVNPSSVYSSGWSTVQGWVNKTGKLCLSFLLNKYLLAKLMQGKRKAKKGKKETQMIDDPLANPSIICQEIYEKLAGNWECRWSVRDSQATAKCIGSN